MTNKQAANTIIKTLHANGFTALLAGGCVRDMLMKKTAKDYDVVTIASPAQVSKLFKRTLKIGAKFGVVIVMLKDQRIEVATFRTESGYADGRHPETVAFADPKADALRRDFTINGMFYDPIAKKVIDFVNGRKDLENKVLRTIGSPALRFSEDYLRMLRAVRFSTRLAFKIEPKTFAAIKQTAKKISAISAERIAIELEGILTHPNHTAGLILLNKSLLARAIFPGLTASDLSFAAKVFHHLPKNISFPLALTALFSLHTTASALESCMSLKLSTKINNHIEFLLANRGVLLNDRMPLAQLRTLLANPCFDDLFRLQYAIQKAAKKNASPLTRLKKRIKPLINTELLPKPLLNGNEIMRLGVSAGPAVGKAANELYTAQLNNLIKTKKQAIAWLKSRIIPGKL